MHTAAQRGVLPRRGERMKEWKAVATAALIAVSGAALVIASAMTDHTGQFRVGLVLLLCGLAGYVCARGSRDTDRLIAHQAQVARLTVQERQLYTELGWKAALIDTDEDRTTQGEVVPLPTQRPVIQVRQGGSA